MTHASVFSGIGGPEVAAAMLGWENLFHCEINPFGRAVLEYWFPNATSYEDITTTDFSEWGGKVNVLTGGFPCQPFSYAGQRRGAQDDRYLWPYMHRCINQVRPDWVVCENVAGILTMVEQGDVTEMEAEKSLFGEENPLHRYRLDETFTLERICNDLEGDGYAVQAVVIPACAVNAPHRRDRVFIIGHRIVADTDNGANGRTARKHEGTGGEEWLQERHEVRQPDQPTQVRPTGADDAENTMCSGQLHGQHDIAGSERDIGDTCTGNCERVCRETSGFCVPDPIRTGLERQDQPRCGEGGQRVHLRRDPARCHRQDDQERATATDTDCRGEGTPRKGDGTESDRCDQDKLTGQRGTTTQRDCGLHAVLRPAADPNSNGQCSCGRPSGRAREKMDSRGAGKPFNGIERLGASRPTPDPDCNRGGEMDEHLQPRIADGSKPVGNGRERDAADTSSERPQTGHRGRETCQTSRDPSSWDARSDSGIAGSGRWDTFPTQSPVHRGNDGIPFPLDDLAISPSKWRTESLKAYGNAIVPQVMYEIFKAIESTYK